MITDDDNEGKAFLKGAAVGVILGFMFALLVLALVYWGRCDSVTYMQHFVCIQNYFA